MPSPIRAPQDDVIPTTTAILSGGDVWACGFSLNASQTGDNVVRDRYSKSTYTDQFIALKLNFEGSEYLTRVETDLEETSFHGNVVLFTNEYRVFLYGNAYLGLKKNGRLYTTFAEVQLPDPDVLITDYKISGGCQLACGTDGGLWFANTKSQPTFLNEIRRSELKRYPPGVFVPIKGAENIQKIALMESKGLALDNVGNAYSLSPLSPLLEGETTRTHFGAVEGIPKNLFILSIGLDRICSFLLDNEGEIWVVGKTVDTDMELDPDNVYHVETKDGKAQKWPREGSPMRDAEGNLNAEEIYIGTELHFLRQTNGDWWSWRNQQTNPTKQDQFFKHKLIFLGNGYALFATPPPPTTSHNLEQNEDIGYPVVAYGFTHLHGLGIETPIYPIEGEDELANWEEPEDPLDFIEKARIVPGFMYKPPIRRYSRAKTARKYQLSESPESKRQKVLGVSCDICGERATRSCGGCAKAEYCDSWCASYSWRNEKHHENCQV